FAGIEEAAGLGRFDAFQQIINLTGIRLRARACRGQRAEFVARLASRYIIANELVHGRLVLLAGRAVPVLEFNDGDRRVWVAEHERAVIGALLRDSIEKCLIE